MKLTEDNSEETLKKIKNLLIPMVSNNYDTLCFNNSIFGNNF